MTALELSRASARTDALFRAHHDEVYRTLLRDLGSPADAEDGTQAVFLSAFRSLERGCAPWSARAWLLAIAKNVARRAWRERARAAEGFEPDDVPAAEAPDEARRELFDALEALPAPQSRALLLHELCGMRYDEISEVTEQTVAGVETTVFRARRAVRSALLNDGALGHDAGHPEATGGTRVASTPSSTHGANSCGERFGNVSSKLQRSPFGSMMIAGMPSIAASSSSVIHKPVFPLPVMPTHTACVTRSFES